jgi:uncharacterized protein (TIGR00369 family)
MQAQRQLGTLDSLHASEPDTIIDGFSPFASSRKTMPITPEELTRRIRQATPFIDLLGVEVVSAGDDQAVMRLPMRPELTQDVGFAHGGVVGALADLTANMAWRPPSLTVEYKINFLRGAQGKALIARARLLRKGSTVTVSQSEVYGVDDDGNETLAAVCIATLAPYK